jgi:hypothetical protein
VKTLCILWCIISSQEQGDRIGRIRRLKTKPTNQNTKIRLPPSLVSFMDLSCLIYFIALIKVDKKVKTMKCIRGYQNCIHILRDVIYVLFLEVELNCCSNV